MMCLSATRCVSFAFVSLSLLSLSCVGQVVAEKAVPQGAESSDDRGVLRKGEVGTLVEALQRTLNDRLDADDEVSIDGDFGPATEAAVQAFQIKSGLDATGVVNAATWKALGKLRFLPDLVADPEVIAAQKLPVMPRDSLDGPPFVTCKAWAIGDGETGQLRSGENETVGLPMASTTKIMTAYLVLRLAEQDSQIVDEKIAFSRKADLTRGSTSGVREGESLSVDELMYGLMLPSGNDASVALAEHFGERVLEMCGGTSQQDSAYRQFVRAMNRMADQLGMDATEFQNTHGLSKENHVSSASDLLKLAAAAMKVKRFRDVVSTRQRGCTLKTADGDRRNVLWKNTNRLLGTAGYVGVKTGTTSDAGSCLVSMVRRDGQSRIVVVLGATSSDARYVDTRNLFRWEWQAIAADSANLDQRSPRSPVSSAKDR
ncbi:peptidoglycan-binding protein [Planctomycetes bacterium K23_9]|uniref:D-alanyl-D-alanine carboxypeptidase n=1 Tax=Stieleria marina TaxID=1930275 RepID=A0A517P3A9_9BACT|nr:D-alanyl-D-alanine carboxypeptidase precursor [Planctomycetes bacterium K23_9]